MSSADLNRSETVASRPTHTVESLLRRADAGDTSVVPDLRSLLQLPAMLNLLGNLASRVECDIVDRLAGRDLALQGRGSYDCFEGTRRSDEYGSKTVNLDLLFGKLIYLTAGSILLIGGILLEILASLRRLRAGR